MSKRPACCSRRMYPEDDPCNGYLSTETGATAICPHHETEQCPDVDIAAVRERYLVQCGFGKRYCRPDEARLFGGGPGVQVAADGIRRYWSELPDAIAGGRGFLLTGRVGTGKTFALAATALRARGLCAVRFVFMPTLANLLHERDPESETLMRADLLLLDDFGVEYSGTDWGLSRLQAFVEYRHSNELATCITTNLSAADLRALSAYERIISRWREDCSGHVYSVAGEDLRQSAPAAEERKSA